MDGPGIAARCHDGAILEADAAILPVPLPLLPEIMAARSTWDIASCNSRETSALASSEKEDWIREPVTRFVAFGFHWWKLAIFDPNLSAAARRGSSAR
jgi:hypothetical protein